MRTYHQARRGIALLSALFLTSPAFAAGKRSKSKQAAPARARDSAKKPDAEPEPAPPADVAAASASEAVPAPEPASPAPAVEEKGTEASAPIASTPKPEPELIAEPATSGSSDSSELTRQEAARLASGRTEVAAFVGAGAGGRYFRYSDPIGRLLAPYRLAIAPMASFELEAYPLAATNVPGLRDIGFRGRVSRAFALNSKTPDGATIDTSWTRFSGEVRYRVIAPGRHRFELGIVAGMDASYFAMSTESKVAALVPSARSVSARFGFDAELLAASRFSLLLAGGYLATTSPGEIYDRFRSPHVAGVDAGIGFALALAPGLALRLNGLYTRYFSSFNPNVGDPAVAGGALDQQWQFGLGVRYAH